MMALQPDRGDFYILNLFDLIATTIWVHFFGLGVEFNPIGIMLLKVFQLSMNSVILQEKQVLYWTVRSKCIGMRRRKDHIKSIGE